MRNTTTLSTPSTATAPSADLSVDAATVLHRTAAELEARVRDLSDQLVDANATVTHHRDALTNAVGQRTFLQRQLDSAQNTLQHLGMILPMAAAAAAIGHPLMDALIDAANN